MALKSQRSALPIKLSTDLSVADGCWVWLLIAYCLGRGDTMTGEVESSIELQPFATDDYSSGQTTTSIAAAAASTSSVSRPVSAASITSTRSMPEMGGSGGGSRRGSKSLRRGGGGKGGSRVASQGGGAVIGRRKLQALDEDEQQLKKIVAAVKARGGVGDGWRLYAPGMHVGLNCKTEEHIVEKQSFANGLYSGLWGGTRRGGDIGRPTTPGAAVVGSREANAAKSF